MSSDDSKTYEVYVNLYDASKGFIRAFSKAYLGLQVDAYWQVSVVVHNTEYIYNKKGITPAHVPEGQAMPQGAAKPQRRMSVGHTTLSNEEVEQLVAQMKEGDFRAEKYHLLFYSSGKFAKAFVAILTGYALPDDICEQLLQVLRTPTPEIKMLVEGLRHSGIPSFNDAVSTLKENYADMADFAGLIEEKPEPGNVRRLIPPEEWPGGLVTQPEHFTELAGWQEAEQEPELADSLRDSFIKCRMFNTTAAAESFLARLEAWQTPLQLKLAVQVACNRTLELVQLCGPSAVQRLEKIVLELLHRGKEASSLKEKEKSCRLAASLAVDLLLAADASSPQAQEAGMSMGCQLLWQLAQNEISMDNQLLLIRAVNRCVHLAPRLIHLALALELNLLPYRRRCVHARELHAMMLLYKGSQADGCLGYLTLSYLLPVIAGHLFCAMFVQQLQGLK